MVLVRMFLMACLACVLAACATGPERAAQAKARLAAVQAAAGKPVNSFLYPMAGLYSWQPISDHQVLVYTRPNRAWLLDVGVCPQLPWAMTIGISTHVGRVSRASDRIYVPDGVMPCLIQKIQPVDVAKLRQHAPARGGAKAVPAAAASSAQ